MKRLRIGSWHELQDHAATVRYEVFVQEQRVPEEQEMDELDPQCVHAVVYVQEQPVATGRLLPNAHIGRMAVRSAYRGQGLGAQVLLALMEQAKLRGDEAVHLSAQLHALPFYSKYGFVAYGDIYQDAGIDHRMMQCHL